MVTKHVKILLIITILSFLLFSIFFKKQLLKDPWSELECRLKSPLQPDDEMLIKYVKEKHLTPPSTEPYNLTTNREYNQQMKWSSTLNEIQLFMKQIFANKTNGFFVEAGALDGQFLSNTLWLEKELNWTGILIEPDPKNYKDLLAKNRKAWISNSCISSEQYPQNIVLKSFEGNYIMFKYFYRANAHDENVRDTTDDRFSPNSHVTYRTVQCFTLHTYLLALGVTHIDFLSLDTQGGEVEMMYKFPWENVNVIMVVIEDYVTNDSTLNKNLIKFMNRNNFIILSITKEPDYLFVKRDHKHLINLPHEILQDRLDQQSVLIDNKTYSFWNFIYVANKT